MSTDERGIGTYPVGVLAALLSHDRKRALRKEWRYMRNQAKRGNWRAVRNCWNGYLAEWHYPPEGLIHGRCGTGWTRKAALRSLGKHIVAQNLSEQEAAR